MKRKLIDPVEGGHYLVKHSSGLIEAKFLGIQETGFKRRVTHYRFENLKTGREIVLKSRAKIKKEWVVNFT